jgi:hypothetical protein
MWLADFIGVAHNDYSAAVGEELAPEHGGARVRAREQGRPYARPRRAHRPGQVERDLDPRRGVVCEMPDAFGGKEFEQNIQGVWLIEIPTLPDFPSVSTARSSLLSARSTDRYRASYGRRPEDHPRGCIFAGRLKMTIIFSHLSASAASGRSVPGRSRRSTSKGSRRARPALRRGRPPLPQGGLLARDPGGRDPRGAGRAPRG